MKRLRDHVRKTGLQSEWSVCPHREACSIWSKQCQEVCHSSFCVLGCATTLQPEVSGAKQTKGFSSHLRGTIRVGNPLGAETDSRAGQSQEERQAAGSRLSTLSLWLCSSFSVVLLHVSTPESLICGSHHSASSSWERSQNRTTVFCLSDGA